MPEVIRFREVRYVRAASRPLAPEKFDAKAYRSANERVSSDVSRPPVSREDVRRAILLLDIAAQQARLLVKKISDPSRRENFEAQVVGIEQLLQLARQMASDL